MLILALEELQPERPSRQDSQISLVEARDDKANAASSGSHNTTYPGSSVSDSEDSTSGSEDNANLHNHSVMGGDSNQDPERFGKTFYQPNDIIMGHS